MTTTPLHPSAPLPIYWRLFPADVCPPEGCTWHEVLVQIQAVDGPPEGQRAGIVYVWTYNPATRDPIKVFSGRVDDVPLHLPSTYAPRHTVRLELATDLGPVRIEKSSGCGCRNPLRGLDPLAG